MSRGITPYNISGDGYVIFGEIMGKFTCEQKINMAIKRTDEIALAEVFMDTQDIEPFLEQPKGLRTWTPDAVVGKLTIRQWRDKIASYLEEGKKEKDFAYPSLRISQLLLEDSLRTVPTSKDIFEKAERVYELLCVSAESLLKQD